MQLALQAHGYAGQPVTGDFQTTTEANVLDFQRRHRIHPVSGIVGPQTRAALGRPAERPSPPAITTNSYSRRSYCGQSGCHLYLSRTQNRRYARWLSNHPASAGLATAALSAGACQTLRLLKSASIICQFLGQDAAGRIAQQSTVAARRNACLRLTFGIPADHQRLRLLTATPDNGRRCQD